jgi:DNA-binding beta-propeller fold protein YncE
MPAVAEQRAFRPQVSYLPQGKSSVPLRSSDTAEFHIKPLACRAAPVATPPPRKRPRRASNPGALSPAPIRVLHHLPGGAPGGVTKYAPHVGLSGRQSGSQSEKLADQQEKASADVTRTRARGSSSAVTAIAPNSIAVIDPRHTTLVADIALHTRPASIAYGAGSLWVAAKDDQTLQEINPRSHRIVRTIGLGVEPATIATSGRYVWVLGANTLLQFDGDTGTLVREPRLGGTIRVGPFKGRPLPQLAVETIPWADLAAGGGAAWVAYGFGVVVRVDARTGAVKQINADSSFGISFGDDAAWSVSGEFVGAPFGTISRIDARTWTGTEIPPSNVGADPLISHGAIAAGPTGVWAISYVNKRAFEIDPNVRRYTAAIPLNHPPHSVAVGAGSAWLANDDATVSRIDSRTAAVIKTIPLGHYPRRAYPIDLTVGGGMVWVALH